MAVIIYRRKASQAAVLLAQCLRDTFGLSAKKRRTLRRLSSSDLLVCWGEEGPPHNWSLNNVPILDKLEELDALEEAGVPVVQHSREPIEGWLPRSRHHSQGRDLTTPPTHFDYFVKKEDFEYEVRVHVWNGLSIRAGRKRRADGEDSHEWIRSRSNGWVVDYSLPIHRPERDSAKSAVAALGLLFGAVDVGVLPDGQARVLEVNRAPGLEGNTVLKYAELIAREYNGRSDFPAD